MKIIFYSYAKTHFHRRGFALSLILKVRAFGTRTCQPRSLLALTSFVAIMKLPKKLVKFVPSNSPIVNLYNLKDFELNQILLKIATFLYSYRPSLPLPLPVLASGDGGNFPERCITFVSHFLGKSESSLKFCFLLCKIQFSKRDKKNRYKSKFQFAMSYSRRYRNSHGADFRGQGMRSGGPESYDDGSEMSKELDQTGQQTNDETSSRQQRY